MSPETATPTPKVGAEADQPQPQDVGTDQVPAEQVGSGADESQDAAKVAALDRLTQLVESAQAHASGVAVGDVRLIERMAANLEQALADYTDDVGEVERPQAKPCDNPDDEQGRAEAPPIEADPDDDDKTDTTDDPKELALDRLVDAASEFNAQEVDRWTAKLDKELRELGRRRDLPRWCHSIDHIAGVLNGTIDELDRAGEMLDALQAITIPGEEDLRRLTEQEVMTASELGGCARSRLEKVTDDLRLMKWSIYDIHGESAKHQALAKNHVEGDKVRPMEDIIRTLARYQPEELKAVKDFLSRWLPLHISELPKTSEQTSDAPAHQQAQGVTEGNDGQDEGDDAPKDSNQPETSDDSEETGPGALARVGMKVAAHPGSEVEPGCREPATVIALAGRRAGPDYPGADG